MKIRKLRTGIYLCLLALPIIGMAVGQGCGQFRLGDLGLEGSSDWGSIGVGSQFVPAESSGLRMLTVREYDDAVVSLFQENQNFGSEKLPADAFAPFDNFTDEAGSLSDVRVRGYESAASEIVARLIADTGRMRRVLPCLPSAANDSACFTQIISQVGMLAFRRPLAEEEIQKYLSISTEFAQKAGDYRSGLEVFFKIVLQHPAFLYRWEIGEAVDGNGRLYRLNDFELASRLAFTLWGTGPDLALLEAAARGDLSKKESYLALVNSMIEDDRAKKLIDFFHASWFGYSALGDQSDLAADMRAETRALLERVVFDENRPWRDILTSQESYLTAELASHYDAPAPSNSSGSWVRFADGSQRKGLFGQGSFLAVGAKFGDTSPVQRGYNIRKHVFCEMINPPPPGVDLDVPPGDDTPSNCKEDKHHASTMKPGTSCISCHQLMDTIGFGLERYDALGGFRTQETQFPECKISGQGEVLGYGTFNGPAELAQVALKSGRVERCLVERWVQFSNGKRDDNQKKAIVDKNLSVFQRTGKLKDLIKEYVTADDFRYRSVGE